MCVCLYLYLNRQLRELSQLALRPGRGLKKNSDILSVIRTAIIVAIILKTYEHGRSPHKKIATMVAVLTKTLRP